jgi:ABC-2 type transport system ATP-binding protein
VTTATEAAIQIERVSKRYGRGAKAVDALRAVTLRVGDGEIFGLLGRNGAGKTTLVKILLDIVRPGAGSATLLGRPARDPRARAEIGYLPEDHRFPEYQTAESAMHYYAMLSGVPRSLRARRVPELLALVGLHDSARRKIRGFSKGMKQRLGVAQALVHEPRILLLDEPTDGVDPVGRAEIRDVLLRLQQQKKTVFLNSHLLSEVERLCDRVAILERGEVVREGSIDELTASGNLYSLVTAPPLDDAHLEALRGLTLSAARSRDGVDVTLREEGDVDQVVDWLRARGIGIRALALRRASLEEVFLEAVGREEA